MHAYRICIFIGKSLLNPPPFILGLLHPPTMKPSVLPPEISKTVYFTPWTAVCYSTSGLLHCYCSKPTVRKPPRGKIDGFEKFRG